MVRLIHHFKGIMFSSSTDCDMMFHRKLELSASRSTTRDSPIEVIELHLTPNLKFNLLERWGFWETPSYNSYQSCFVSALHRHFIFIASFCLLKRQASDPTSFPHDISKPIKDTTSNIMAIGTFWKRLSSKRLGILIQAFSLIAIFFEGYDQGVVSCCKVPKFSNRG